MQPVSDLRSFLTTLLEIIEGPACIKDREHRWVAVNEEFCRLMGHSREEILDKREADFFPPEFVAASDQRENEVLEQGAIHRYERRLIGADGGTRTLLVRQFRVMFPGQEPYVGTVLEDQTTLRDTRKRLNESEQRRQVMFESSPVGVAYIGRNGRFRDMNARFAQILGYSAPALIGQNYAVTLHADESSPGRTRLKELFGGGLDQFHFEKSLNKRDGEAIEVAAWISAIKSEGGETDSAVIVLEDISERKGAEKMARAQSGILEQMARNVPLPEIFRSIVTMVTADWKGVGCAILGQNIDQNKLILQVASGLRPEDEKRFAGGVDENGLLDRAPGQAALPIRARDGTLLGAVAVCGIPPGDPVERHRSWLDLARGMAEIAMERKHVEQRILDQQVQLFAASRMVTLGEMAAGIAHEINNPLAVIHGRAGHMKELVSRGKIDAPVFTKGLAKIEETAMRIAKIIRGLRSFAREGGADPFQPAKVADVVADSLEFCRARFLNHEVDLKVAGEIDPTWEIECRFVQIGQVLLNLLSNAFDAVQEVPERWVKVNVRDLGDSIEMSVTDSGKGIPPELREKIMEPFFTTKEVGKGTGLGLSIVRGIVESHRGKVRLDAQSTQTRFVVTLPKLRAQADPIAA